MQTTHSLLLLHLYPRCVLNTDTAPSEREGKGGAAPPRERRVDRGDLWTYMRLDIKDHHPGPSLLLAQSARRTNTTARTRETHGVVRHRTRSTSGLLCVMLQSSHFMATYSCLIFLDSRYSWPHSLAAWQVRRR